MFFLRPIDFLPRARLANEPDNEIIIACQLTALSIPKTDPDSGETLTLEQRLKLLEMEVVGEMKETPKVKL